MSTDGKGRSFPTAPPLLQYVSNGNNYGRIELNGKVICESLETTVRTTATLKLADLPLASAIEKLDGGIDHPGQRIFAAGGVVDQKGPQKPIECGFLKDAQGRLYIIDRTGAPIARQFLLSLCQFLRSKMQGSGKRFSAI